MTVISSKEFSINQEKYFDLALNEQVFVQRGDYMFIVTRVVDKKIKYVKTGDATLSDTSKLSDKFRGVFSKEIGKDFINHTKVMREEWDSI